MGKVIAFALEAAGAPIVKGGSGAGVAAFRALIEAKGGEIRCGADVDRILVREGKVRGVALASREEIACASVLASVAPGQLQDRLRARRTCPRTGPPRKPSATGAGISSCTMRLTARQNGWRRALMTWH